MLIMKINIQAAAHYLYPPPLIPFFAEPMMVKACCAGVVLCRMLDSVRCCKFDPFYSSLPKQTALRAHSSPAPSKLAAPWPRRVCLLTTILVPSCVCSDHCHQSPASGCWPLPLVHHWHLMTSWLLLSRQNLIVLKYNLLVKHHTSTSQR